MSKLLRSSETWGCGATIELGSGEVVFVSIDKCEVLVREIEMRRGFLKSIASNFYGRIFYQENKLITNVMVSEFLERNYGHSPIPHTFSNHVLFVFASALWGCARAEAVMYMFEQAKSVAFDEHTPQQRSAIQWSFHEAWLRPNWKELSKRGYARYNAYYSDGSTIEVNLIKAELQSWSEESNKSFIKDGKPFTLLYLASKDGQVVWRADSGLQ